MPDEKKITSPDDEYQFPQDEYVASDSEGHPSTGEHAPVDDVTTEATQSSRGKKWAGTLGKLHLPPMKNKRIIIVIVVVLVLIFIIRALNSRTETPKPIAAQPTQEITAPVVVQQSNDNDALNSLSSLTADSSDTKSKVKDLQSQLADLQSSFALSQASDQALQKTVTQLAGQINTLSVQLNTALAKLQAGKTGKKLMVFHLRAVLPDRAWITSDTGETLSITVGDHVKQYGTVQSIDSEGGVINTSSGRKIKYGTNDY